MNGQGYTQLSLDLQIPDQPECDFPKSVRTGKEYLEHFRVCSQCRTRFDN